jgi:hypothetical protein
MSFRAPKISILSMALLAAACASVQAPASSAEVPTQLKPGANESLAMVLHARGVQIYECRTKKDAAGEYEWTFVAPEADLYDSHGAKVGHHFAGPHWESADGSRIVGTTKARADAPSAGAIPWLLLSAKSDGAQGAFSAVTSVQRVSTAGGLQPEAGCSGATAGTQARVDYTADYNFFTQSAPVAAFQSREFSIGY